MDCPLRGDQHPDGAVDRRDRHGRARARAGDPARCRRDGRRHGPAHRRRRIPREVRGKAARLGRQRVRKANTRYAPDEVLARSKPTSPAISQAAAHFDNRPAHLATRRFERAGSRPFQRRPRAAARKHHLQAAGLLLRRRGTLRRRRLGPVPAGARRRRGLAVRLRLQPRPHRPSRRWRRSSA